jgi:hypothetical protein
MQKWADHYFDPLVHCPLIPILILILRNSELRKSEMRKSELQESKLRNCEWQNSELRQAVVYSENSEIAD